MWTRLANMIHDHRRRQASRRHLDIDEVAEPAAPADDQIERLDGEFLRSWRDELLSGTWEALGRAKRRGGLPFHVVLESSTQNPKLTSVELAKKLNDELCPVEPFSEVLIRKTLQLAREKFADLLVDEVASSLGDFTPEKLEQELIDLNLLGYCRGAMELRWILNG